MKKSFTICLLAISLFSSSCKSILKSVAYKPFEKIDVSIVPSDFDPKTNTLLFVHISKRDKPEITHPRLTAKMEKVIRANYPFPFEIVKPQDLSLPKYKDPKYRFVVVPALGILEVTKKTKIPNQRSMETKTNVYYWDFLFYDRESDKKYPPSGNTASYFDLPLTSFLETVKKAKGF